MFSLVPPHEFDCTRESSEDVFEDEHDTHGDNYDPNRTISEIIDFRIKSLSIDLRVMTDNDAAPLGKEICTV